MKKLYLLLIGFGLATTLVSQNVPRIMLVEHFTQASCGPCASYNPAMRELMTRPEYIDRTLRISYQTSWPGVDPMNEHNPTDVATRRSLYSVNSVPNSVIDGNYFNGHPADWDSTDIETRTADSAQVIIDLTHEFDDGLDSVIVTMVVKPQANISGSFLAHIAVVEDHIEFSSPPGSNGEKNFYNVMKKMLPDANGTNIGSLTSGDSIVIREAWMFENVYEVDSIAVVGWVQNSSTKEVEQAAYSVKFDVNAKYDAECAIRPPVELPRSTCDGMFSTNIILKNNGANDLTSADISYSVNGGTPVKDNWTGTLKFLDSKTVSVDISYDPSVDSDIKVFVSNPNGMTDSVTTNDTIEFSIAATGTVQENVLFDILLDGEPYQTSWELVNVDDGSVVDIVFNYADKMPYSKLKKLFTLEDGKCYEFTMKDSEGDGLTSGAYYSLKDGAGNNIVVGGGNFLDEDKVAFIADASLELTADTTGYMGVENDVEQSSLNVYPNPATDQVVVELSNASAKSIKIFNSMGVLVSSQAISKGATKITLDTHELEKGVYFIEVYNKQGLVDREKLSKL